MLFTDNMNAKLLSDLRKEVDLLWYVSFILSSSISSLNFIFYCSKLRHPNILLFMGACTEPVTPCIVTEFLARGSLASILMDQSITIDWGLTLQVGIGNSPAIPYCAQGSFYNCRLRSRHGIPPLTKPSNHPQRLKNRQSLGTPFPSYLLRKFINSFSPLYLSLPPISLLPFLPSLIHRLMITGK